MNCPITQQLSIQAHTDIKEDTENLLNEVAVFDLFQHGRGEFSNGEIELCDVVDKAFKDEYQLASELFMRTAMNDLHAKTESTLLLRGIAEQMNEEMANSH